MLLEQAVNDILTKVPTSTMATSTVSLKFECVGPEQPSLTPLRCEWVMLIMASKLFSTPTFTSKNSHFRFWVIYRKLPEVVLSYKNMVIGTFVVVFDFRPLFISPPPALEPGTPGSRAFQFTAAPIANFNDRKKLQNCTGSCLFQSRKWEKTNQLGS